MSDPNRPLHRIDLMHKGELATSWITGLDATLAEIEVDLTALEASTHDPVTVGTGLDVTGQLVELDLSEVASGGELGGTMDAPTVDALHSGSTHAATLSTAEGYTDTAIAAEVTRANAAYDTAGAAAAAQAASQPLDSDLTAFAALAIAADKLPYGNGSHTLALADFTAAGRALIDDADAAAQRTTLGLGTAATHATGDYDAAGAAASALTTSEAYTDAAVAASTPSGVIVMFGGAAAPTGWLLCDGTSKLRATYPGLFTAIGVAYGSADGTHFNVPDLQQRFPLGKAASGTGATLGDTGGAIDHLHTGPSHTHTTPTHAHTLSAHTHTGPSHTHSTPTHAHTLSAHTHTGPSHTHTTPTHAHTLSAHTHTGPSHTHTGPSHSHTSAAHTHTMANHTHTGPSHSHTSAAHTHGVDHDHTGASHTHALSDNGQAAVTLQGSTVINMRRLLSLPSWTATIKHTFTTAEAGETGTYTNGAALMGATDAAGTGHTSGAKNGLGNPMTVTDSTTPSDTGAAGTGASGGPSTNTSDSTTPADTGAAGTGATGSGGTGATGVPSSDTTDTSGSGTSGAAGTGATGAPSSDTTDTSGSGTSGAAGTGATGAPSSDTTDTSGSGVSGAAGTGNTGTNNPPFLVVNFIIKT